MADDNIKGRVQCFLIGEKIKQFNREQRDMEIRALIRWAKESQAEIEARYNHNHDPKNGRFTSGSSGTGLTGGRKSGKMVSRKFNTLHDPMAEVTGAAEISHPKEILALEKYIKSLGAELIRPDKEELNYQPGLRPGQPGRVVISKGASYSAWLHEVKHLEDDHRDGFLGYRVFQDRKKCAQREIDAYAIEINLAKQAKRPDIIKRLEALRDAEISQYR